MAVPNVTARIAFELCDDSRNHSRMCLCSIFPTGFVGGRWHSFSNVFDSAIAIVILRFEWNAIENLKANAVKVDRMRIVGEIHQAPDSDGVQRGIFSYRHAPVS